MVNYFGRFYVFDMSKKNRAEMRKRNEALLKFDRERAERLIAVERKMSIAHWWWCLLCAVTFMAMVCYLAWNTR